MEDKIKEILRNGPLLSQEIATQLGKHRVKDIQKYLNKLLKADTIQKNKIANRVQWSLADINVDTKDVIGEDTHTENYNDDPKHINTHVSDQSQCGHGLMDYSYQDLLQSIILSHKEEILFLKNEIKVKNELIASQQEILTILVSEQNTNVKPEPEFKLYKKTFNKPRKVQENNTELENRFDVLYESESDDVISISSDVEMSRSNSKVKSAIYNKREQSSRPPVVTIQEPEKQHYTNNYKRGLDYSKKEGEQKNPLILLIGDSTVKQLSSYQLKKSCKGTNIMVRSLQGGRIKNIKNLCIDMLEDVTPDAICVHVSTNDISDGRSVEDIITDMENIICLIQQQGIVPIISLVIQRMDRHASKVDIVNKKLIRLCNHHGVGYILHQNITPDHLNPGGLHIARQFISLFSNNFVAFFKYLVQNHFCIQ